MNYHDYHYKVIELSSPHPDIYTNRYNAEVHRTFGNDLFSTTPIARRLSLADAYAIADELNAAHCERCEDLMVRQVSSYHP